MISLHRIAALLLVVAATGTGCAKFHPDTSVGSDTLQVLAENDKGAVFYRRSSETPVEALKRHLPEEVEGNFMSLSGLPSLSGVPPELIADLILNAFNGGLEVAKERYATRRAMVGETVELLILGHDDDDSKLAEIIGAITKLADVTYADEALIGTPPPARKPPFEEGETDPLPGDGDDGMTNDGGGMPPGVPFREGP